MVPKILEFEDNVVKVTAAAYAIPEIKAVIDKYKNGYDSYITFIHAMSAPDSPYINIPAEDKLEAVVYDIQASLGEFDYLEPLLQDAIDKICSLYKSPPVLLMEDAAEEVHRLRAWLRETPYGDNENVKTRIGILKDLEKISVAYKKARKEADDEMKVATKGDHEIGDY